MRIGIVSEHPLTAHTLRRVVSLKPAHRVVWIARSGAEAVDRCTADTPDLLLMDLLMSVTDGVNLTRRIMTCAPCAIVIVTDSVRVNAALVFEAMGAGALDAVDMPGNDSENLPESAASLLAKIATISRLLGERGPRRRGRERIDDRAPGAPSYPLVAIGASAGGPAALATLLAGLPRDFPAAIVIVQHLDEEFCARMAEWLGHTSGLQVSVALEGNHPTAGRVLMAGTSDHLILKAGDRLGYTEEPRHHLYRPSIDVFFESVVSRQWRGDVVGVLLTGMGKDGALGLKKLRDHGHHTIAQDEASSVVYGMPKAAAALKAAVDVLPVERIAARLIDVLGVGSRKLQVASRR